jgi:superfamily II DNA or RNA helicase
VTFHLRPYQEEMIEAIRAELRISRSVVAVAPTGSGKTALAAFMIGTAANRGKKVWMTVHRDFLLTQTAGALDRAGVEYGFIASGFPYNPHQQVHIVSIQTLVRRLARLTPPDLLVIDECHHAPSATWAKVHRWAGGAHHVGLTASPARLDGRGLGDFYGALVRGPSPAWLIERGFLSAYRAFAPGSPDLAGVHTRAGEYVTRELAAVMDTSTIVGNVVDQYRKKANGKRAIYFAVSIDHSKHIAAGFTAAGVPARHLDADSSLDERIRAAGDLAGGQLLVVSCVDLFGEGYDLSAQAGRDVSVEAVGLCRPTQSLTLHLQQIGRALRPKPKPAVILDHAGNIVRHGLPDEEREWSLDGVARKKSDKDTGPAAHVCESCYGTYPTRLLACPYCDKEREIQRREVEEVNQDLVEADARLVRAARFREQARAESLLELRALAAARGYKPAWAEHVWKARQARGGAS